MKFDDIAKFEVGQVFYENGYGQSVKYELTSEPVIKGDELHFRGINESGGSQYFIINKNYKYYGPNISLEPEYVSIEEISKWILLKKNVL